MMIERPSTTAEMGIGPVPAIQKVMQRTNLPLDAIDHSMTKACCEAFTKVNDPIGLTTLVKCDAGTQSMVLLHCVGVGQGLYIV